MFDFAKFQIVGRVGKIKHFDKLTRVSIAANADYQKDGEWVKNTLWNEVVIFNDKTITRLKANLTEGDYVRAEGSLRNTRYERNGETVFSTDLICEEFYRQPTKAKPAQTEDPAPVAAPVEKPKATRRAK